MPDFFADDMFKEVKCAHTLLQAFMSELSLQRNGIKPTTPRACTLITALKRGEKSSRASDFIEHSELEGSYSTTKGHFSTSGGEEERGGGHSSSSSSSRSGFICLVLPLIHSCATLSA